MWAQLGPMVFELMKTPNRVTTDLSWEYPEHKVIRGKALLQYLGESLEKINLDIRFHYSYCEPYDEEQEVLKVARRHTPLPFILGTGDYIGDYVIERASRTWTETHKTGQFIALDMSLSLKECPQERMNQTGYQSYGSTSRLQELRDVVDMLETLGGLIR